jgi:hypothetical protein
MMATKSDTWLLFEVYPCDLDEREARFVGRVLAEDDKEDETVLEDQGGHLYYLRAAKFDRQGDFVSVRTEWFESGGTPEEIYRALKGISAEIEFPKILERLEGKTLNFLA